MKTDIFVQPGTSESTQQMVLDAENDVFNLQLSSIQTGEHFLTINGAVETELRNQAANYCNENSSSIHSSPKTAGFWRALFGGASSIAMVIQLAGIVGVCVCPEGTIFNMSAGLAQSGKMALMMAEVTGPTFEAVYQTEAANSNYKVARATTSMNQLTQTGGVFAGNNQDLTDTEQDIAAALAARIRAISTGERSTTIY